MKFLDKKTLMMYSAEYALLFLELYSRKREKVKK